jgi:membrane associated rhomboid family serine protease
MERQPPESPLNPLPVIVWVLALPLVAMEVVLSLAEAGLVGGAQGIGWRLQAMERFGLFPELLRYQWQTGGQPYDELQRLVSYPLVHGQFTDSLFTVVLLLALGKMVGEVFRWWAVVVVVFGAAIAGGLAYGFLTPFLAPDLKAPLIGGNAPIYGLIGAFTYVLLVNQVQVGGNKFLAFRLIGFLLAVQVIFGLIFGGHWRVIADIAAFATGFLLSFVVSPGGFARVVQMIRQR